MPGWKSRSPIEDNHWRTSAMVLGGKDPSLEAVSGSRLRNTNAIHWSASSISSSRSSKPGTAVSKRSGGRA